jgi:DNA-binding PadR family transcriptional regulator
MTGYEIKKRIDTSLSFFWKTGYGQIYPTLKQMEENRWINKRGDNNGKLEKIIYSITEEGRKQLINWLTSMKENEDPKFEILLKLFFGGALEKQKNMDTIQAFKEKYAGQLPVLKEFQSELEHIVQDSPDHLYYLITVLFGVKITNAYIEWADEALKLLETTK